MSDFVSQAQKTVDEFPLGEAQSNELLARARAVDAADARAAAGDNEGLGSVIGHYLVYLTEVMRPWLERTESPESKAALDVFDEYRDHVAEADAEQLRDFRAALDSLG